MLLFWCAWHRCCTRRARMRGLISHLRYTARLLLKSPGFTITAVLVLGLGIGANTAIFSLVNGVLLKPLPYPRADRLVTIYETVPGFDRFSVDYPDYVDFRSSQRSFEDLAACNREGFTLTGRGEANVISGVYTTGSLFRVLGRSFLFGVPFGDDEARPVVAISERLWRSKFQQDPKVIGENLSLDGRSFEIIGVTPAQASEGAEIDVYLPW
jgi:putative ABC transport system permease protein